MMRAGALLSCVPLFAALAPSSALAGRLPRYGGDLRLQLAVVPADLDPLHLSGDDGDLVAACVYEGLARWDESEIEPALARHWVHDEESRRWLFQLRGDVLFHDGTRCDAPSIQASLQRLADPRQSPCAWILSDLVGWDDFVAGRATDITGIDAQPDQVELRFAKPVADLPARLALPAAAIVRRQGANRYGTGPFKPGAAGEAGSLRLVAFKDYWAGRPFLDRIELASRRETGATVASHDAELLRAGATEALPAGSLRMRVPAQRLGLALVRPGSTVLASDAQRRRLSESFDRGLFVRTVLAGDGQPADGLTPQVAKVIASRPAEPQADLASRPQQQRARILVAASEPVLRALAERLQVHLFGMGLNAELDVLPGPAFLAALVARNYDVVILGWTPPQPRGNELDAATRVREFVSNVAEPVLGGNLPASWTALKQGSSKDSEAVLLRGAYCMPLVFFHDIWQTTADVLNVHPGSVSASLGLANAHLDPTSP